MEPERPVEKVLRAYAKKRREEAGAARELHPATRRLLQGEVARQIPPRERGDRFLRIFEVLRPRLAFGVFVVTFALICGALFLPALSASKSRAMSVSAMSNLKQIGLAAFLFAQDNNNRLPVSLAEMKGVLKSESVFRDPQSGEPFVYIGGGRRLDSLRPDTVLAYAPESRRGRVVLFADGHVQRVSSEEFAELSRRGSMMLAAANEVAREASSGIREEKAGPASVPPASAAVPAELEAAGSATRSIERPKSKGGDWSDTSPGQTAAGIQRVPAPPKPSSSSAIADASSIDASTQTAVAANAAAGSSLQGRLVGRDASGPEYLSNSFDLAGTPVLEQVPAAGAEARVAMKSAGVPPALSAAHEERAQALNADAVAVQSPVPPGVPEVSQRFVQDAAIMDSTVQNRAAAEASLAKAVLNSFQMEQNGREIRIVDEDGSVYNGSVQVTGQGSVNAPAASLSLPVAKGEAARLGQESAQQYAFRVTGYNRSLRQNVVFAGNLLPTNNRVPIDQALNVANLRNAQFQSALTNLPQLPLANSRVSGTVLIDDRSLIEVNAVPAGFRP